MFLFVVPVVVVVVVVVRPLLQLQVCSSERVFVLLIVSWHACMQAGERESRKRNTTGVSNSGKRRLCCLYEALVAAAAAAAEAPSPSRALNRTTRHFRASQSASQPLLPSPSHLCVNDQKESERVVEENETEKSRARARARAFGK